MGFLNKRFRDIEHKSLGYKPPELMGYLGQKLLNEIRILKPP